MLIKKMHSFMPSTHRQKIGVKIGVRCLLIRQKIGPFIHHRQIFYDKNRSVCAAFSPLKNRSDIIQEWGSPAIVTTQ